MLARTRIWLVEMISAQYLGLVILFLAGGDTVQVPLSIENYVTLFKLNESDGQKLTISKSLF